MIKAKKNDQKNKAKAKKAKGKSLGGRPTLFKEEYIEQVEKICALGAIDEQLKDFFNVSIATIHNWKNDYPSFLDAIKRGKSTFDNETVVKCLLHRATGYSHDEEKIFNNNGEPLIVKTKKHYPPDTTAMIYWLNNRDRKNWMNKQEFMGGDGIADVLKLIANKLPE